MGIGANLRRLRREQGLTQSDLAERVACWFTAISNIERGDSEPSLELATKLADALGVTVDELVRVNPEENADVATEPA